MMKFSLEPEVAGQLGEKTEIDTSVHPPIAHLLHHVIDGWLGDDLLECFPCFIVTATLREKLEASGLSGFSFADMTTGVSDTFKDMYPDRHLPEFHRILVTSSDGSADLSINDENLLIASEAAMTVLKSSNIDNCDIEFLDE